MNKLDTKTRKLILRCLVEGMSIRATARTAEVSKLTVSRLMVAAGKACADYQDKALRELPCRKIQCDEIWSFIYCKDKTVKRAKAAPMDAGDVWTWTAICADTKLVPAWRVGDRSGMTAIDLMDDLRSRLASRVQLTTDGHKAYLEAVEGAFGGDVDYAMLVKIYGDQTDSKGHEKKYSPAECTGIKKTTIEGRPKDEDISTSYVERQNLTMRMSMRRFTRLTNAFSKKIENHHWSVALHFMHYNFCRIHQTLRVTPAMEAGVTDRLWDLEDIIKLVDDAAPKPNRPKTYKRRNSK
ncbi:MAG: IS1 family transposase [Boseongicola sp.]|nr:IS1 family transposase [Boseongicola sp.]